ncbi:hypothetical protein [Streptomyces sp. NPDC059909]|uniref:hypothetical protein n=1 Tax=Streptomyces sp. NPDC059909 TaxID=3346998 RepID=UPI00365F8E85
MDLAAMVHWCTLACPPTTGGSPRLREIRRWLFMVGLLSASPSVVVAAPIIVVVIVVAAEYLANRTSNDQRGVPMAAVVRHRADLLEHLVYGWP